MIVCVAEGAPASNGSSIGAHHTSVEGFEEGFEVGYAGGDEGDGYDDFAHEDRLPQVERGVVNRTYGPRPVLKVINLYYGGCDSATRCVSGRS